MAKIRVLDENLINKIAAGEVIENPASVVKELVENAIDAGSTDICVEIQGGGRQLIRISDDGSGMDQDDALLSLERHATSKIRDIDDIHSIQTMGFRGEAVPSIASISKFTILTSPKTAENSKALKGTLIIVDGGKIIKCCEAVRSPGTTIEVKSLFFNVPVRKKFQKSPTFDANEIQKTLSTIALGNPTVKFQLINNQENVFTTAPILGDTFIDKLGERINSIMGEDFYKALCPISTENPWCKIEGWIGQSFYNRHNRSGQYLFINQRPVQSPLVSYAVRDGYGTALPSQRHPVFVLHLTLEGSLVDVNVHPQKREVRLRQDQQLRELISKAVQESLQSQGISSFSFEPTTEAPFFPGLTISEEIEHKALFEEPQYFKFEVDLTDNSSPQAVFEAPPMAQQPLPWDLPTEKKKEVQTKLDFTPPKPSVSIPKVTMTLPGYFVIDESPQQNRKGLSIVDQRAAHARILFEKLLNREEEPLASQTLLIPYTLEFSPYEAEVLKDHIESLQQLGIELQHFGGNTFAINAIPTFLNDEDVPLFINGIVHNLQDESRNQKIEKEKKIALAASRAAITTKKQLTIQEAQGLIQQLMHCNAPFHCPQGKPTMILLSGEELAKHFEK